MRQDKRLWIYGGLGIPEGVALVKRPVAPRPMRVLFVGNESGRPLVPILRQLAEDSRAPFTVDLRRRSSVRQWLAEPWLFEHLAHLRPTTVFFALDPRDVLGRRAIHERVRRAGGADFWLAAPGILSRSTPRFIAAPASDARSLAAWAARAWNAARRR
jgi:hypothetical protein